MQTLRHHGRSTAYRYREASDGSGPGIVCIHGSGGSHAVWKGQFELADRTSVAAVDLSGHGASEDIDADPGYETLEAYAEDVVAVIEATDCSVILGHSLGGAVALWAALEHDLSLDGLVLAGTSAKLAVLSDLLDPSKPSSNKPSTSCTAPAACFTIRSRRYSTNRKHGLSKQDRLSRFEILKRRTDSMCGTDCMNSRCRRPPSSASTIA